MDDPAIADLKWIDSTSFATPDEKTFINYRRRNTVTKEEQAADVSRSSTPQSCCGGKD
jgi:hypothetical protein